jgi:hypothetical protein
MAISVEPDVDVLSVTGELIRFDTTNPPGNERGAVEYLERLLADVGIETTVRRATQSGPTLSRASWAVARRARIAHARPCGCRLNRGGEAGNRRAGRAWQTPRFRSAPRFARSERVATDPERDRWWPKLSTSYPGVRLLSGPRQGPADPGRDL